MPRRRLQRSRSDTLPQYPERVPVAIGQGPHLAGIRHGLKSVPAVASTLSSPSDMNPLVDADDARVGSGVAKARAYEWQHQQYRAAEG